KTHRTAREINLNLSQLYDSLRRRSDDLAASNRRLKEEIVRRKSVEGSLRNSEQHYDKLLDQSHRMQDQLRFLSRQLLSAQEEERKRISRELHDVIDQPISSLSSRWALCMKKHAP